MTELQIPKMTEELNEIPGETGFIDEIRDETTEEEFAYKG